MTIKIRRILSIVGQVGIYACLCAGLSQGQATDKSRATLSASQKSSTIKLEVSQIVYPYYEWIDKDTALAWGMKLGGSVVAIPLTGEHRAEKPISGASTKEMEIARAFGLKMSPDGSKILYLEGYLGSPAGGWRVGTLDGTSYKRGKLIELQGWDLFWMPNSREWVSLAGDDRNTRAIHYYVDGSTPPVTVPIRNFAPKRDNANRSIPQILGIRQDGNAIVTVKSSLSEIDFYLMDLDRGRVLAEHRQVDLPVGKSVRGMTLSHSGDRIAWLFNTEKGSDDYLDVWLSNADGSDLKRFSDFPTHKVGPDVPGEPSYKSDLAFYCPIRWTIDDKAISCLQGDTLQIVPVK
ncbi:MAG: hypothetical protein JWL77_4492 [Chthonomonadaceae bacterium]|nr:hypothetical protein [Chthonomonadaceae bacterium]